MALWSRYLEEVWYQKRVLANWEPNEERQLGDYGVMTEGVFRKRGTLKESFRMTFDLEAKESGPSDFTSASGSNLMMKLDAKAGPGGVFKALGKGDIGFRVTFSEQGAVVTRTSATVHESIRGPRAVRREILRLTRNNEWNDNWYFIESRLVAPSAVVVVAQGEEGAAEVKANVKVPKAKGGFGMKVAYSEGAIGTYESGTTGMAMQFVPVRVRLGLLERILRSVLGDPEPDEAIAPQRADTALAELDDDMVDALFAGYAGGNTVPDDAFGAGYSGGNLPPD